MLGANVVIIGILCDETKERSVNNNTYESLYKMILLHYIFSSPTVINMTHSTCRGVVGERRRRQLQNSRPCGSLSYDVGAVGKGGRHESNGDCWNDGGLVWSLTQLMTRDMTMTIIRNNNNIAIHRRKTNNITMRMTIYKIIWNFDTV